jgi:hypothetical protein
MGSWNSGKIRSMKQLLCEHPPGNPVYVPPVGQKHNEGANLVFDQQTAV